MHERSQAKNTFQYCKHKYLWIYEKSFHHLFNFWNLQGIPEYYSLVYKINLKGIDSVAISFLTLPP